MARTRTAGIRLDSDGRRIVDKEHRGVGIYLRLGPISQEDAEQQLANEVARIDAELRYNANHRHRFVDCAERLSLPITRRAPGHRAAVDPITRPTVHSGDANRQYRETGPPYPALVDAPCAGSVRPSIRKDAFASHGSNRDIGQRYA